MKNYVINYNGRVLCEIKANSYGHAKHLFFNELADIQEVD